MPTSTPRTVHDLTGLSEKDRFQPLLVVFDLRTFYGRNNSPFAKEVSPGVSIGLPKPVVKSCFMSFNVCSLDPSWTFPKYPQYPTTHSPWYSQNSNHRSILTLSSVCKAHDSSGATMQSAVLMRISRHNPGKCS